MFRAAITLFLAVFAFPCAAQEITGTWIGPFGKGMDHPRWTLRLSKNGQGQLSGEMWRGRDVTLTLHSISWDGSKLIFSVRMISVGAASFEGVLSDDGNWIDGWMFNAPLKLERSPHLKAPKPRTAPDKPGTATAASIGTMPPGPPLPMLPAGAPDPSAILSRAVAKLAGTSRQLRKYACTETVERSYYNEPTSKLGAHPMSEAPGDSCDGRAFGDRNRLRLDAKDRLRLQIAVADGKEIYSWAAASRFDSRSVFDLIPGGPMSTGAFGTELVDIFENPGARYEFQQRKVEQQREIFQYSFDVPLAASHVSVRGGTEFIRMAYHGSFEIDAASADLLRLTVEMESLPPETKMCRARTTNGYHYARIGNGEFLLPSQSEFSVLNRAGGESHSMTTFAGCHEYTAESSLSFGDETPAAAAGAAPRESVAPLPPGIPLTLALLAPIDTATAAAGDPVSAKVVKAVRAPGTNEILVEAGATVHGRITTMRVEHASLVFQFAIRYETMEQRGSVVPLAIELERTLKAGENRGKSGLSTRGSEFALPELSSSGELQGWFSAPALSGRYVVPAGSESKWVTVAQ